MTKGSWASDLIDFLLPTGCLVCRDWIPTGTQPRIVCARCCTRLRAPTWPRCPRCHFPRGTGRADAPDCLECREWPTELTRARYPYGLEGPAADLVHALKYEGWREAATFMSRPMAAAVDRVSDELSTRRRSVVMPIPTTERRKKERGYNQAELLSVGVSRALGLPHRSLLLRAGSRGSQTTLTREERRENVRGAFSLTETASRVLQGADVILVDDVLTTGATASEVARALGAGGAKSVVLVTFARALPGRAAVRPNMAA